MSIFNELKRRNVFRVAVAYLVAAWVIAQVTDLVLENIGAPTWVMQSMLLLLSIGFIVAIIISWAYEVTPDGIRLERDVEHDEPLSQNTARRLDIITIGLLIAAIGFIATDRLLLDRIESSQDVTAAAVVDAAEQLPVENRAAPSAVVVEKSIAVLPFIALSADENDTYFGKGVAEELLNALAQLPDLKVAARTSAFSFAEKDMDLRWVGESLGVAHVLEGSIRRSGERLRITAQLIRAADGFHLWSATYERRFADIFDIQDEIVAELSRVLQIRLGVGAGAGRAANHKLNAQAYELYLRGLDSWWTREDLKDRASAVQAFLRVTELDPEFADGWAAYAVSVAFSDTNMAPHLTPESIPVEVTAAFARALEIDPNNPRALAGLVYWHLNRQIDIPAANQYLERALAVAPGLGMTNYAASQFYFSVGDERRAVQAINRAIVADPLNLTLKRTKFMHDAAFGRYDATSSFLQGFGDCTESVCGLDQWQKAWFILAAALHASEPAEIARMRDIFDAIFNALDAAPEPVRVAHEFLTAYTSSVLEENTQSDYWGKDVFRPVAPVGTFSLDASIFAQQGFDDQALDVLERVTRSGRFFASRGIPYVLWPGRLEIPEHIRRHPRYHDIWSLPGMPEISLARRANGQSAGLPMSGQDPSSP